MAFVVPTDNYTLGRGAVLLAPHKTGTKLAAGYRDVGNSPALSINITTNTLDHYSARAGAKEKDGSFALDTTRTATLEIDNINSDNLALLFLGSASTVTDAGGTVTDEVVAVVELDRLYQLGQTASAPFGIRGIAASGVTVTNEAGSTTYVENTDYVLDRTTGLLQPLDSGSIAANSNIKVDYTRSATSRSRVISGSTPFEGAMQYIAENAEGTDLDFFAPYVKITPNGDFELKGDNVQKLSFKLEILKATGMSAMYIDGRPV